jgi:hypothetical protein
MAYIESAFYGDEKTQRDTTKVLHDKVSGTGLDVDVNESMIPPFEVVKKVEITNLEEKKIRDQATKSCGGVDQQCISRTEAQLRQEKLTEKQNEASSAATAIKGRRLTVNIIDENGNRRRIVIPDGQKFKLDNVTVNDPKKGPLQVPSTEYIQNQMKLIAGIVFSSLAYVFSIVATYTLFVPNTTFLISIPAVAMSVFVPYSGYFIVFFFYMFRSAVDTYVGDKV